MNSNDVTSSRLVIQFCKALDMDLNKDLLPHVETTASFGGPWMTLGYFDAMQIYPLPDTPESKESQNWFSAIWSHNIKLSENLNGHYYVHPFHIMADFSTDVQRDKYKKFWEMDSNCLFVTLTQAVPSIDGKCVSLDSLEQKIQKLLEKKNPDVSYVFYHTLELSDLVIIWKATSMRIILEQLQKLYYQPFIGDLNTFCGISYHVLDATYEKKKNSITSSSLDIPRISMRFITRDAQKSHLAFTELKNYFDPAPHFVTGAEDMHIIWPDAKESSFYCVLHHCFLEEDDNAIFRKTFQEAFREVETHIGIPIPAQPSTLQNQVHPPKPSPLTEKCQKLLLEFGAIIPSAKSPENECDYSWMKSIRNQLNEMLDMSQSYVVDGLCYLALDSVNLFCSEIKERLAHKNPLTSKEVEGIQRFVRGWGFLTEQAGRADGRFTHSPGFSPPLYDIPSSLLEFYLAFTKQSSRILQEGGSDENIFAMLIVPKLCRRIKVQSVFNFRKPPCPRLLYVDIPLDTLYEPFTVLCQLVHEISHFCGELWRNRKLRTNYYLSICAYELAMSLALDTSANVSAIQEALNCEFKNDNYYLSDLQAKARETMLQLVKDDNKFSEWMALACQKINFKEPWQEYGWKDWCLSHRTNLLRNYSNSSLMAAVQNITDLFKECYADISMIQILELNFRDYMALSLKEIRLYNQRLSTETLSSKNYYNIVLRWATVSKAAFGDVSALSFSEQEPLNRFFKDICQCLNYIDGKLDPQSTINANYFNSSFSLNTLISYLSQCSNRMKNDLSSTLEVKYRLQQLRAAFHNIAYKHIIECESCNQLVSNYRDTILR